MKPVSNDPAPGEKLSLADVAQRTAVVVGVVLAFALAFAFLYALRRVLLWVLVAGLLAASLAPAVSWLERHGLRRWVAATIVSLLAAIVILGTVSAIAVPLAGQARQLIVNIPRYAHDLLKPTGPLGFVNHYVNLEQRIRAIHPSDVLRIVAGAHASVVNVFTRTLAFLAAVVTIITITLMLLVEGPRSWAALIRSQRPEHGRRMDDVGRRMQHAVAGYVRGNLLISLFAAVGSFIAMSILAVPYPLPLALAVGLLDIIPLIGAMLGAAVCVLVALTQGWLIALILVIYFVIYQQMENHLLLPVIFSRTVAMSPLTVLLVSLAGAILGGLVGVIIAIPLASGATIIVGDLLRNRAGQESANAAAATTGAGPPGPRDKRNHERTPADGGDAADGEFTSDERLS